MLIPEQFAITDKEGFYRIMEQFPLGALITRTHQGLDVNHIPFELITAPDGTRQLVGHVARLNPVWQQCTKTSSEVLVIFRGNEGYISPGWYPTKKETHRFVPTWNYEVVHARGIITVRDDEKFIRGVLARLTRRHEASEPTPWKMGDSAPDFINEMLKAVVGIEVSITHLEGMVKLSQNRDPRDLKGAIDQLDARNKHALASAMKSTSK